MIEIILDLAWYLTQPTLNIWVATAIFIGAGFLVYRYIKKNW